MTAVPHLNPNFEMAEYAVCENSSEWWRGKGKVSVLVSIFGRETPVELDFLQVTKI